MHWSAAYIGMPHDPADRHCWAFCRQVWRERAGIEVPEMPIDAADQRAVRRALSGDAEVARWREVAVPAELDAVLMAQGARPCHVGIWLDLGGALHSIAGPGAIFTPRARLGDLGYRVVGYYRRAA